MAISAAFTADFSQWKIAVDAASASLNKLKGDASATQDALTKMTDAQAGRFAVTTAEMEKAGFATTEWTGKIGVLGGALSGMGLNIGSQISAVGKLSSVLSTAAGSLGAAGTAAAVLGSAVGGWLIGRKIAEVLGLDAAVAQLAVTMGLFEDPKTQTAAARMDVLTKASAIAKREIQDYATAVQIVNDAEKERRLGLEYSRNAAGEAGQAYAKMYGELGAVRARGDLPALKQQLESYDFSLQTLSTRFGVHVETLDLYRKNLKAAADQEQEHTKKLEDEKKALDALIKADWASVLAKDTEYLKIQNVSLQTNLDLFNKRTLAEFEAQKQLAALKSAEATITPDSLEGITAAYEKLQTQLQATGSTAAQQEVAYLNYQKAFLGAAGAADTLTPAVKKAGEETTTAAGKAAAAAPSYQALGAAVQYAAGSFQNMYTQVGHASGYEASLRELNDMASAYGRAGIPVVGGLMPGAPHRAGGGPVQSGSPYWVGEQGPELFVPGTSGAIQPNGAGGSVITVNVSGLMLSDDPQSRAQLAAVIQDALMTGYRRQGSRLPLYA